MESIQSIGFLTLDGNLHSSRTEIELLRLEPTMDSGRGEISAVSIN